jgi:hypothetical protein
VEGLGARWEVNVGRNGIVISNDGQAFSGIRTGMPWPIKCHSSLAHYEEDYEKFAGCASTSKIRTGYLLNPVGLDSTVGIAARYSLPGPGIESQWGGASFSTVQTGPGAHPASCTVGTGSFPGVKWPGRGVDHPPPYSAEVKERVELYLYFTSGPSWPGTG